MKKLAFLFLFVSLVSVSQIADWYAVDLSRLGYKHNSFSFETPYYNKTNGGFDGSGSFETFDVKGASIE